MERNNDFFRIVLLHYFDLKKKPAHVHKLLKEAYGNSAPSERTCRKWFQRFKSGDCSTKDKERNKINKERKIIEGIYLGERFINTLEHPEPNENSQSMSIEHTENDTSEIGANQC